MTPDKAARLIQLRPDLMNIIGFYDLMDRGAATTPLDAMSYQVHFTASSLRTAQVVSQIINELLDEA